MKFILFFSETPAVKQDFFSKCLQAKYVYEEAAGREVGLGGRFSFISQKAPMEKRRERSVDADELK